MEDVLLEYSSRQVSDLGELVGGQAPAGCSATSAFRTPARTVVEPLADPKRKKVLVVDDVPVGSEALLLS
jgi:hypothetical protein